MKTIWKVIILLIAAGLILSLLAIFLGASRWVYWDVSGSHIGDNSYERITELDLEQIKNIEIFADFSNIEFIESDKYGIDICYFNKEVAWNLDDGNLSISSKSKNKFHFFNIDLSFQNPKEYIKVFLPAGVQLGTVSVETGDGDIRIGNFSADDVQIKNSFGKLDIFLITCHTLQIELADGAFTGEHVSVQGDMEYKNDFGISKFKTIQAKHVTIQCSDGDITLNDCKVESIDIRNGFGSIVANNLISLQTTIHAEDGNISVSGEFLGQTVIHNNFGNTEFTTSKPKEDYTYNISTEFGNVTVDNDKSRSSMYSHNGASENSLCITNSDGNITVNFAKHG